MKNSFIGVLIFMSVSLMCTGQVVVKNNRNAQALAEELTGNGVVISEAKLNCGSPSRVGSGTFSSGSGNIGIKSGIVLSTGSVAQIAEPNSPLNIGYELSGYLPPEDNPEIYSISNDSNSNLYDVCELEFDIEVSADSLSFNFIFASEEYCEFTGLPGCNETSLGGLYNDVFGFFISGPGINGVKNLAVVPNTNEEVSIRTINHVINSQLYMDNPEESDLMAFDGYTIPLRAKTTVVPCEKYHLRLAIADAIDPAWDSGVFLESGSLESTFSPSLDLEFESNRFNYAIEGCSDVYLTFSRSDQEYASFNDSLILKLNFEGSSVNGVDYLFPDTVVLEPQQNHKTITLKAIEDNIEEEFGSERVVISIINQTCITQITDEVSFFIRDDDQIAYNLEDIKGCEGDTILLNQQGNPNTDSLVWERNQTLSCFNCFSPNLILEKNDTIYYTYYDKFSSCFVRDSLIVTVDSLTADFKIVQDSLGYTSMDVFFKNHATNYDSHIWNFGDENTSFEVDPVHTYSGAYNKRNQELCFTVELVTQNVEGCQASKDSLVCISSPLFVPNLITNNKDGKNEKWIVEGIFGNDWNVEIYDRWGDVVYITKAYDNEWDGEDLKEGVYFYTLKNKYGNRQYTGWVHLLK